MPKRYLLKVSVVLRVSQGNRDDLPLAWPLTTALQTKRGAGSPTIARELELMLSRSIVNVLPRSSNNVD